MKRRVLFIGAHPDDIEINAGGTVAEMLYKGHEVGFVICSHTLASIRGMEAVNSSVFLGGPKMWFLGLQEPNVHHNFKELVTGIEKVVHLFDPDTVFTHYHADTHQDHETVCKATMASTRFVPSIYMYHPTYPSGRVNIAPTPNVVNFFSDISLAKKLDALAEFKSQSTKYGEENWLDSVSSICKADAWRYGGKHGNAEVFQLSRKINFCNQLQKNPQKPLDNPK